MNQRGAFDNIDRQLLSQLQSQGRCKQSQLAEEIGLSVPAVGERLRKLEDAGVISAYRAVLDPRKLGFDVAAFISVTVDSSKHYKSFLEKVEQHPFIVECHAITGEGTHMLKIRSTGTEELEKLLSTIQSWSGISKTTSRVVLSSPKETTALPLLP